MEKKKSGEEKDKRRDTLYSIDKSGERKKKTNTER